MGSSRPSKSSATWACNGGLNLIAPNFYPVEGVACVSFAFPYMGQVMQAGSGSRALEVEFQGKREHPQYESQVVESSLNPNLRKPQIPWQRPLNVDPSGDWYIRERPEYG